jgi:hypothetical protein
VDSPPIPRRAVKVTVKGQGQRDVASHKRHRRESSTHTTDDDAPGMAKRARAGSEPLEQHGGTGVCHVCACGVAAECQVS